LSHHGGHYWQSERQEKGKTAKSVHLVSISSKGVRKHTTAPCSAPPFWY
jgi:hypothetical protein